MSDLVPRKWAVVAVALVGCAAYAQPPAQKASPDLSTLALGQETARARSGDFLYVALGSGGVAVVDVRDEAAPKLQKVIAPDRRFVRAVIDQGVLLLIEEQNQVTAWRLDAAAAPQPVASLAPATAAPAPEPTTQEPPQTAPPVAAAPSGPIEVLKVESGRVLLDAGRAQGFEPGAHVRIVSQRLVEKPDLVTGATTRVPSGEVTAVVEIEHADETRSLASLGRGDVVDPGDTASLTREPLSEKLLIPRRAPFTFLAGFHVRPFVGLNTQGKPFAALADVYLRYYLPGAPVAFGAELAPIGIATGAGTAFPITATGYGAFTSDFFEVGLGLGGVTNGGNVGASAAGEGAIVSQLARLGALDGINLHLRTWVNVSAATFSFAGARGELNLPFTSRFGLFGGGGGGANGWGFGDLGVRTMIGGTGAAGTTLLSASLGYAALNADGNFVGGPTVAFGLEWRR